MNRQAILRKARALRRLAENPAAAHDSAQAAEAERARALLERLQRKYKLSDIETQDPSAPPPTRRWAVAPISCQHLLVDFVAAVIGAGGGAVQPSARGMLMVVAPVLELKRLVRLAERTAQLLQTETAERARLAQAMRLPFDAPSLWTGIVQGLVRRLLERAEAAGGGSGEPRRGDPEPGSGRPPAAAAESRAEATPSRALVLYQSPPKRPEMPLHRRQVDIVNRMDLQHGHQVASRFQFDVAGDLPVTPQSAGWRPPAARETSAQGFARAEAWLDGVKASIGDNPIVTAFAGAVIGGMRDRDATREYAGVLWDAWRKLGDLVRRESLASCGELLQPELADPRRSVLASMCGENDEPLRAWCTVAGPRVFELDAAIDRERRARAEAEKARREAELAEDLKRWAERQPVEEWSTWVNNPAPTRRRRRETEGPRVDPVVKVDSAEELERFKEALHKESSHQYSRALHLMDELEQADDEAERRESARLKDITKPAPHDLGHVDFEQLDRTINRLQREQRDRAAFHLDARIADEILRGSRQRPGRRG